MGIGSPENWKELLKAQIETAEGQMDALKNLLEMLKPLVDNADIKEIKKISSLLTELDMSKIIEYLDRNPEA